MVCDKVVCDKVVCERWCVTKLGVKDGVLQRWCVKEGVWKMVCDKVVCVTKLCVKDGVSKMVGDKVSEAPATQNERGCEIVPRLPREIKVDVTKCHACHAKRRWM